MSAAAPLRRPVRSFVRREGRFTAAQRRAVETLLPRYGVPDGDAPLDFKALFGRTAPVHVEIGFGNGEALCAMAATHPENDYLGIEVHRPGVGSLLQRLDVGQLTNIRIACRDAVELLARVPDGALDAVYLFFPDPWPKLRHHKRRLVQPEFVATIRRVLRLGGLFRLATDWEAYADHMWHVVSADPGFSSLASDGRYVPRPDERPQTRFESRGRRLGHPVRDLAFRRVA